jgi:hypothetical protein
MKRKIDYLITDTGLLYERVPKGKFQDPTKLEGVLKSECIIKHLGRQIYLIGYYGGEKQGGYKSSFGYQNRANKFFLLFPSGIKIVVFK